MIRNLILNHFKLLVGIFVALLVLCVGILIFAGNGDSEPTSLEPTPTIVEVTPTSEPTPTEVPVATDTPTPTPDSHEGMIRSELDNRWIDAKYENKRPVAIMFNNIQQSLPQVNMEKAGVIYECEVEGTITRFLALIDDYDTLGNTGSIRSSRTYYIRWAMEWDSFYMHIGGPTKPGVDVTDLLREMEDIDGTRQGGCYHRDPSRVAPHNGFTNGDEVVVGINNINASPDHTDKYDGKHFKFAPDDSPEMLTNGTNATVVKPGYTYNNPVFTYNAQDGLYYREQYNNTHYDGASNAQFTAKNIIIQFCSQRVADPTGGYLDVTNYGSGEGYYITNGKCIPITWSKESNWKVTHYYDLQGNEIQLNTGRTWIEVVNVRYKDSKTVIE